MSIVYLNGQFMDATRASISPMDRSFLFADGVYEVVPVFGGGPLRMQEHLQRLEYSLDELRIGRPASREQLTAIMLELVRRNGGGNLSVYLQVSRGATAKRDHAFPVPPASQTIFMTTAPLGATAVDERTSTRGESAITAEDIRWLRCDIKSVALLPNVLMRQRAIDAGAAEAILIRQGLLTEGSSSNVFVVKRGRIATPPLSPLILGGITRELVLEVCRLHGLPFDERGVPFSELADADEIWVSSSTRDVLPIVTLDGRPVGCGSPGPVWRELAIRYAEHKRQLCAQVVPPLQQTAS